MTQPHLPGDGGPPDWTVIGGGLAALATIATAIAAALRGGSKSKDNAQAAHDKNATDNATLTLDSVFRLVNELQDEVRRKSDEIISAEKRCTERVGALEEKIDQLLIRIGQLETEIRALKAQIP